MHVNVDDLVRFCVESDHRKCAGECKGIENVFPFDVFCAPLSDMPHVKKEPHILSLKVEVVLESIFNGDGLFGERAEENLCGGRCRVSTLNDNAFYRTFTAKGGRKLLKPVCFNFLVTGNEQDRVKVIDNHMLKARIALSSTVKDSSCIPMGKGQIATPMV